MKNNISIIIISTGNIVPYGTTQLRCIQPAEYLKKAGFDVRTEDLYRFTPSGEAIILLHRTVGTSHLVSLVQYAKSLGSTIIYDTDDLTFHEEGANYLMKIGHKRYKKDLEGVKRIISECDAVSVSTTPLSKLVRDLNPNVYVNKNALSYSFYKRGLERVVKESDSDRLVVGYLSGSKTHDEDFKVVEPALIKFLNEYPSAEFLSVGPLYISDELKKFGDRVYQLEFVPYSELHLMFEKIDINLIPLKVTESFCQSKSELKFIEAGIHGVPSVASPTVPHQEVIQPGENGYLADTEAEWYECLSLLAEQRHRFDVGEKAKLFVMQNYSPEVREKEWGAFIRELLGKRVPSHLPYKVTLFMKFRIYKFGGLFYRNMKAAERYLRVRIKNTKR